MVKHMASSYGEILQGHSEAAVFSVSSVKARRCVQVDVCRDPVGVLGPCLPKGTAVKAARWHSLSLRYSNQGTQALCGPCSRSHLSIPRLNESCVGSLGFTPSDCREATLGCAGDVPFPAPNPVQLVANNRRSRLHFRALHSSGLDAALMFLADAATEIPPVTTTSCFRDTFLTCSFPFLCIQHTCAASRAGDVSLQG